MTSGRGTDVSPLLRRLPQKLRQELADAPKAGDGVHQWIFRAALKLHRRSRLSDDDHAKLLIWAVRGCGRVVSRREIDDAIRNSKSLVAHGEPQHRKPVGRAQSKCEARRQSGWPYVSVEDREKVLASSPSSVDELRRCSPTTTGQAHQDSEWYVGQLFPGDPLLCIGTSPAKCGTMRLSGITRRYKLGAHALIVPSPMSSLSGISQEGKSSDRCLDNTGPRRFLVTEFDRGPLDEHASLILHLKAFGPLVMVLWSGSKSLHAWWDAHGVPEEELRRFFRYAVSLGADPATWNRCQLVRLPEGWRRDKGTQQAVYYFDPDSLPDRDHKAGEVSP